MNDKVLAQDFKAHFKREVKKGFTLAEVLITLAIIGVVAAMTIPAVIVNTNQAEFKTGLRKAVSVLNSAITLNKALTGESPYDNNDLYNYLQQHMAVMKRNVYLYRSTTDGDVSVNAIFYTSDGMRYEFPSASWIKDEFNLHENRNVSLLGYGTYYTGGGLWYEHTCGSLGLAHNPDSTTHAPCLVVVDVNGDRKPNTGISQGVVEYENEWTGYYVEGVVKKVPYPKPNDRLLKDIFPIMITDQGAIPYGIVAQKAMYQAQK